MFREWDAMPSQFDAAAFQRALTTREIGRFLVYRTTVETTMTIARREADEGAPHGTLVLAEEQTQGRGRRGRSFASPAGENLYFTLVLRLTADTHRRLPLIVPLAACEAVRAEGLDALIKWPNDIWVGARKLSGMLIDAEFRDDGFVAFPGIGINVNGDPTVVPELRDTATSVRRELGRPIEREGLLARICNNLESAFALEPAEVAGRYRAMSLVLGRSITVSAVGADPFEATAEGVDDDGSLRVRRVGGTVETVLAADVSVRPAGV